MSNTEFRTMKGYQELQQGGSELTPTMEDYLEMIGRICEKDGYARTGTLSAALNVKPSSASKMITKLTQSGHIMLDRNRSVRMTAKGRTEFSFLLERHNTIEQFLYFLGNPLPLEETELIEHMLSNATVNAMKRTLTYFDKYPDFKKEFQNFLRNI